MGVDVPDLDDRDYEELLADVRKRIPVVDEAWTDHNAHDPGITVLELLTWIAESYRYRLDRVEDRHRRKYAQLLGVEPESPSAATARVQVAPEETVAGKRVPEGARFVADGGGGERAFETTRAATLTGASVAKALADTPEGVTDHTAAALSEGTYFRAFGERAAAGSALYLGFDGDPLSEPSAPLSLSFDFHDGDLPPTAGGAVVEPGGETGGAPAFEPSVELVWEYCTDYGSWERDSAWEPLTVVEDTTEAFYGSGVVTLAHPGRTEWQGVDRRPPGVLETGTGYAWVRIVVDRPGYEIPPRFDAVRTNVLRVEHGGAAGPEQLSRPDGAGETTARPHQRFAFERAPVSEATVTVGGEKWDAVDDFDASGPDDRHYVLDEAAGEIRFGDNVRGAIPAAGQTVKATYRFGGGPAGNVPATADWWFEPGGDGPEETGEPSEADGSATGGDSSEGSGVAPAVHGATVEAVTAAGGGRPAEDVDDALDRLRRDLDRPYRAVTADDCEFLALHTPGLRVDRAKAVVETAASPGECTDRDAVRVIVVPYGPPAVDRPTPSEGFLDTVRCHLERNRLVTDRVTATAPTYVEVGVSVAVELAGGYATDRRREAVREELDRFLSPLRGFAADGWPFGRPVYHSELYERVGAVEGVDCVTDVAVAAEGDVTATDDAVEIPPDALVFPGEHAVTVRRSDRREEGCR